MPLDHKVYDFSKNQVIIGGIPLREFVSEDALCYSLERYDGLYAEHTPRAKVITPENGNEESEIFQLSIDLERDWNEWVMGEDYYGRRVSRARALSHLSVVLERFCDRLENSPLYAKGWRLKAGHDEDGAAFYLYKAKTKFVYLMFVPLTKDP